MAVYNLSTMFEPQYVGSAAAALVFATPGAPVVVPLKYNYQISVLRVANVTAAPVALTVWRVPVGAAADATHLVTPSTVNIPVATNTFPHFDVTALWGALLGPGDAVWMQASAASSLVVQGDGAVVSV